ncbi:MAG TPA: putative glycolipid-binding domain-containing protein [Micromonosporaceae bacterium]
MSVFPKTLLWRRLDTTGAEQVLFDDGAGLRATGTVLAADPVPYTCEYELATDDRWATARFEATVEGAGFLRKVRVEHAAGRWRVTAGEQGDLDAALRAAGHPRAPLPGSEDPDELGSAFDVDLGYSPLTNTLPIRRLGLLDAEPGTTRSILAVWVVVPSLAVIGATQAYTVLGPGSIRYSSGSFTADLTVDADGYVLHYPGLAEAGVLPPT